MNEETIQNLANKAVAVFLVDWKDTPESRVVERDGAHFLVVKLDQPFSAELHINLKDRCEELLTSFYKALRTEEGGDTNTDGIVNTFFSRIPHELTYIAKSVPGLFIYSLLMLDLLTYRERLRSVFAPLTQDTQESTALVAQVLTQGLLLAHGLTEKSQTKKRKPIASRVINDSKVMDIFLRLQGEVPSIRRLAKELDTQPVAVRTWLRKKGYNSLKELADDLVGSNNKSTIDLLLTIRKGLLTKKLKKDKQKKVKGRVEIEP